MKTEQQIKHHLQKVGYSSKQRVKISAYLLGKGIEIDTKDIKKGDKLFKDFLEWEKNIEKMTEKTANHLIYLLDDINKELDKILETKPKYKVGDCVYVLDINKKECHLGYISEINPMGVKMEYVYDSRNGEMYKSAFMTNRINLHKASKEQEEKLLKEAKLKFGVERKDGEWVDIKKSDKELFNEWKKNNIDSTRRLLLSSINSSYIEKKLIAYTELYLFSQWVNQFYDEDLYYYHIAIMGNYMEIIHRIDLKNFKGEIRFYSKEAAKRAIDCLGEDLIKTVLK